MGSEAILPSSGELVNNCGGPLEIRGHDPSMIGRNSGDTYQIQENLEHVTEFLALAFDEVEDGGGVAPPLPHLDL